MKQQSANDPRIIAGTAKGVKLRVAEDVRPITNRMKQSLFDLISDYIVGSKVVDIYAGSGSLGIEALSRGAEHCTFVENERQVLHDLNLNLEKTKLTEQATVLAQNAGYFITHAKEQFDLVFCDPPFDRLEDFQLHKFAKIMHAESLLIIKYPSDADLPMLKTMPVIHQQAYGKNQLIILGKRAPL